MKYRPNSLFCYNDAHDCRRERAQIVMNIVRTQPVSDETTKPDRDGRGHFVKGHKGGPGRPKGSTRRELAGEFLEDMRTIWAKHGSTVLERVIDEDPAAFLRAIIAIMPKEVDVAVSRYDEMTDDELRREFVAAVREAKALGIALDDEQQTVH